MSLDTLGRAAAARLHDSTTTGLDGAERFLELERTRTRRTRMRVELAAIAAACLVAAGWLTLQSHEGSASELPAGPGPATWDVHPDRLTGNGPIVVRRDFLFGAVDPRTGEEAQFEADAPWPFGATTVTDPALISLGVQFGSASWSADGKVLAFLANRRLFLSDASGVRDVGLCEDCYATLSPEATRVATTDGRGLTLRDLNAGTSTVLDQRAMLAPTWSPDGTEIAYLTGIDVPGPGVLRAVNTETGVVRDLGTVPGRFGDVAALAWSPDGDQIAAITLTGPLGEQRPVRVLLLPSDNAAAAVELAQLGRCWCRANWPGVAWSPDGKQLAATDGDQHVVVVTTAGGRLERLTAYGLSNPAWRPVP